jgi:Arc/MetJ-type ribon-helix-helix transcriptional regulator
MAKNYRQVSLPEPLYTQLKDYVDAHPEFTSIADFLKQLIRIELDKEESRILRVPKKKKE